MLYIEIYLKCLDALARLERNALDKYDAISLNRDAKYLYEQATGNRYDPDVAFFDVQS